MDDTNNKKPVVTFKKVNLSFKDKQVLKDLSFNIYPNEIVTVAGPSGSGKSTILKLICRLLYMDAGEIEIKAEKFGMAFQKSALFNSMTVRKNLSLALEETTHLKREEINKRIKESLKAVSLPETEDMYPDELSGGMQKRISIARVLTLKPDLILYDEPSTGLDPGMAAQIEDLILDLKNKIGVTSIVVTHDVETMRKVSDRILVLYQGKIAWKGTKAEFLNDTSPYTMSFKERRSIEEYLKNN